MSDETSEKSDRDTVKRRDSASSRLRSRENLYPEGIWVERLVKRPSTHHVYAVLFMSTEISLSSLSKRITQTCHKPNKSFTQLHNVETGCQLCTPDGQSRPRESMDNAQRLFIVIYRVA